MKNKIVLYLVIGVFLSVAIFVPFMLGLWLGSTAMRHVVGL